MQQSNPIRLIHCLRAVITHDDFVLHVLNTAKDKSSISDLPNVVGLNIKSNGELSLILDLLPKDEQWKLEKLFTLAESWENTIQTFVDSITLKERQDFIKNLRRKVTLRPVE